MPRAGLAQGQVKGGSWGSRADTWSQGWHSFPKGPGMVTHLVFCLTGPSRTGTSWPGRGLRSPGRGASLWQLPLRESASSLLALKLSGFLSCPEGCEPELGKLGGDGEGWMSAQRITRVSFNVKALDSSSCEPRTLRYFYELIYFFGTYVLKLSFERKGD